jgi:hypothetical protein
MKIKKTLFSLELEVTPDEILRFRERLRPAEYVGLIFWLREKFGLDMVPAKNKPE